jgi:transketolase
MPTMLETRFAYGEALLELGKVRPDVVALDADLYKSTRTVLFRDAFPSRFIDIGISEADMVSTAAGMAAAGLTPFVNSFAIFLTGICYIPIRTQICYPALNVKLVGSSAGLTQGPDGASHQSLEDVALMRGLPNMTVIVPADEVETRQATFAMADWPGPVYLRLGRYPVPRLYDEGHAFSIGVASLLRDPAAAEVALLATGHEVCKALEAADQLTRDGVTTRVLNISTIKPLDTGAVLAAAKDVRLVITVEEHSIIGGLGSAVAEVLAAQPNHAPLLRLGVRDQFGESALADELLEKHGLQPGGIRASVLEALRAAPGPATL